jgi:predicted PurR-regulated permease PerM
MDRWKVSVLVAGLVVAGILLVAPHVLLTVFAGVLLALLLHGCGGWIARLLHLPRRGYGMAIFAVLVIVAFALLGMQMTVTIANQFNELVSGISSAVNSIQERLNEYVWAQRILERANPAGLLSSQNSTAASTAVTSTFGALGNLVIIIVIGIYGALDPARYRRGLIALFAPSLRPLAGALTDKVVQTLKNWLAAQFIAMTVVGTLTGIGLWLVGIPLALILGVIAGLLAFIPNIGPIMALAPGLLFAIPLGTATVLWVLAVYLAVQTLESYLITPMVQQEKVDIPPVLVIAAQLFFGVLYGLMGLALAMPLTALAMTLIRELYVKHFLERESGRRLET